jgi:hypothetical protein
MDMSASEKTSLDIFKSILDFGPLSLYSANSKTHMPIGTIHRHIKQLEKNGKISIYESKTKGRKKIQYGPTIYGMLSFYRQDKKIASSIQNYFLLWIEHKQFQKELQKEGFDISGNLKESKIIFQKYMTYFSAIEDQIDKIRKGDHVISRDVLILISSGLLSTDLQYQKLWQELYQNLPGMRKSLDQYMTNMIKSYKKFKKFNSGD